VGPKSTTAGEHGAHARRLIARVTLHRQQKQVELIIYDQRYREWLIKCFNPEYRFTAGVVTPEGYAMDAGLKKIYPWEPAFIGVLQNRLLGLELRCVPELPLLSWLSRWRRHQGSGDRVLLTERDLGG
jgi:hypothetical protein